MKYFKRRKPVALQDEKNRFFPVSKSSIRHTWNKYMRLCGFTQTIRDKMVMKVLKLNINLTQLDIHSLQD